MKVFLCIAQEFELSPEACWETSKDLKLGSDVDMISFVVELLLCQQCGAWFEEQPEEEACWPLRKHESLSRQ